MRRALIFAAAGLAPIAAHAQDMGGMTMPSPAQSAPAPNQAKPDDGMAEMDMPGGGEGQAATMAMGETGYADGSGTSRNPGNDGVMDGLHAMAGGWMLMAHGYAWGVYTDQGGPRGDDGAFVESMAMLTAARELAPGARLQLRSMLSLEPLMGERGYPDLFATGETAHGVPLIDRQHPHDLFMELSARLDFGLGGGASAFVYGGPVAEPALGPSAFMHRASAEYLPLAPITHHWFDSTHINYGVVTGGIGTRTFQIEGSAFRGREPDEHRWDIETPKLDSWSVRATWTPSPAWSAEISHGRLESPEAQDPGADESRTIASVQYAAHGLLATLAWSDKHPLPGRALTAWLGEARYDLSPRHVVFGRIENLANGELFPDPADPRHDAKFRVTRFEGGYAYRVPLGPVALALGGSLAAYAKPGALDSAYGRDPISYTLFAKLSLGH